MRQPHRLDGLLTSAICLLPSDLSNDWNVKRKHHLKLGSFAYFAGYLNSTVMLFHNTTSERESKAGSVALSGIERTEDVGNLVRRNSATAIGDRERRGIGLGRI